MGSSGENPIARHNTWLNNSHIPIGDRSVHEHFCLSKIIAAATETDQLNLPALKSFELIGRRLQLIESAHMYNPTSPDYSAGEDFMGWGPQRGSALVAPQLRWHVADKAKDRAAVLKEMRKHQEELRLRRPNPKGSSKGKAKTGEAEPQ